ncbi:malto-oligosyltrehalose synthase [Williamsia sterculiae]|uniref:Maltooligosyl trehalose synthase n=1 Tax=Williamsia sterculiae TaxID=1344003 RepID=A0A1N7H638_9NOCA|nr:malto-oligosyltrehalose synthase [Williamsia sterculiae]SIS20309.1 maltooligosyl trehalose synthase [Williamsia sterculiae]
MPTGPVTATYRLQLNADFTFDDARHQLDHIAGLGVSHLYLSPIQTAVDGSTHGYDWVPPPAVSPVLGGIDGLRALRSAAAERGLGIIVDIVPNHTGVEDPRQNPWWWDVLRHGHDSAFASYFDIDWSSANGADGKLALPVLGGPGDVDALEVFPNAGQTGELGFYEHRFPLAPGTAQGSGAEVHDRQHYRLVPWDSGVIGYRRFFAVNGLAGLRQEDADVYAATHRVVQDLVAEDLVDGIRVDHPDGLTAPVEYLQRLRDTIGPDRLLLIEKILSRGEPLDPSLPVQGTTGYEQLRRVGAVLVDPRGIEELSELHLRVAGDRGDSRWLHDAEHALKLATLHHTFPAELGRLRRSVRAATPDSAVEVTDADLDAALALILAGLGVYRADYPVLGDKLADLVDELRIREPGLADAFAVIGPAVTVPGEASSRLAQVCGAVTAKSVEDCLFYRTARLVSSQEVGGDPGLPAMGLDDFHTANRIRAGQWPSAMTALSTHDTKRDEDVRARIGVLSQVPGRWADVVAQIEDRTPAPDPLTGLFLLQNMFGVWPSDGPVDDDLRTRLHDYATKAIREAGLRTTWTEVDTDFEDATHRWIDAVVDEPGTLGSLVAELAPHWRSDSLTQKALSMLTPGFPDIYQGTEWFTDSLVDPDNRRPVDYTRSVDHPKTRLVTAIATLRRDHPDLFGPGSAYVRLIADGPAADHLIAFGRGAHGAEPAVVFAAPRWTVSLPDLSATTLRLPPGRWRDLLSGNDFDGVVGLSELLAETAPVVLVADTTSGER